MRRSPTASSRFSMLRTTVNPHPSITRIGVSRLLARRAIRSRSKVIRRSPAATLPARLHVRLESRTPEPHGIDADVHEDLGAAVGSQRDRMLGFRERDDLAITWAHAA